MTACEHDESEHRATARLTMATWLLTVVTVALVAATLLLADVTAEEKQHHETPGRQATEEVATQR